METLTVAKKKGRTPFGIRLRRLREESGLTLADLAERSGIHLQNLSRLENSEKQVPKWDTVVALAKALGCSTEEFLPEAE
jgi:transcriptional regulator with XRE-family HTH domain